MITPLIFLFSLLIAAQALPMDQESDYAIVLSGMQPKAIPRKLSQLKLNEQTLRDTAFYTGHGHFAYLIRTINQHQEQILVTAVNEHAFREGNFNLVALGMPSGSFNSVARTSKDLAWYALSPEPEGSFTGRPLDGKSNYWIKFATVCEATAALQATSADSIHTKLRSLVQASGIILDSVHDMDILHENGIRSLDGMLPCYYKGRKSAEEEKQRADVVANIEQIKLMPGPWCILLNGFNALTQRHANFQNRRCGYACDNHATHDIHFLALDHEYAVPFFGRVGDSTQPPFFDYILVSAKSSEEFAAGNYELVILKNPDAHDWHTASKYKRIHQVGDPQKNSWCKEDVQEILEKPIAYSGARWIKYKASSTDEPVLKADWVRWAAINRPIQEKLMQWTKKADARLAELKKAAHNAALYCFINQQMKPDEQSFNSTRYQNEICNLEGLGRLWIEKREKDTNAIGHTVLASVSAGAMLGLIAGPPGLGVGLIMGGVAAISHKQTEAADEDERVYSKD